MKNIRTLLWTAGLMLLWLAAQSAQSARADALGVLPMSGLNLTGPFGTPFNTNTEIFSLTNSAATPLTWSAAATGPWLSVWPVGGVLPGNSGTTVTVSLTDLTTNLPPGSYVANVVFTDLTSIVALPLQFSLTVTPLQLIQNGGFETTNFTDWNLSGDTSFTSVTTVAGIGGGNYLPHSGNCQALLGTSGAQGSISQTVLTTPGQTYVLSFWFNATDGETPNTLNVNWNGTQIAGVTNNTSGTWTNGVQFIEATGSSNTVQIAFQDDPSWLALDDVSLQPVATPVILPVSKTGSTLNFQWYAMTGLVYQVQYKTNLLQTNWLSLGSPITATNLLLNTSDTIGANQQRFYRLETSP